MPLKPPREAKAGGLGARGYPRPPYARCAGQVCEGREMGGKWCGAGGRGTRHTDTTESRDLENRHYV